MEIQDIATDTASTCVGLETKVTGMFLRILMSLLLVPEVIRMYLSLKRIDSVFLSLGDIRGFIDIPGKLDNLPLLAKKLVWQW